FQLKHFLINSLDTNAICITYIQRIVKIDDIASSFSAVSNNRCTGTVFGCCSFCTLLFLYITTCQIKEQDGDEYFFHYNSVRSFYLKYLSQRQGFQIKSK